MRMKHSYHNLLNVLHKYVNTIAWNWSNPSIAGYFFKRASALVFSNSFLVISSTTNDGLVFSKYLCWRNSAQSATSAIFPPDLTCRLIAHLASSRTWSTSPFPWLAILKICTTGILKVFDKHCMASKCWADLYYALQLSLSMIHISGIEGTDSNIFLRTRFYKGLLMVLIIWQVWVIPFFSMKLYSSWVNSYSIYMPMHRLRFKLNRNECLNFQNNQCPGKEH